MLVLKIFGASGARCGPSLSGWTCARSALGPCSPCSLRVRRPPTSFPWRDPPQTASAQQPQADGGQGQPPASSGDGGSALGDEGVLDGSLAEPFDALDIARQLAQAQCARQARCADRDMENLWFGGLDACQERTTQRLLRLVRIGGYGFKLIQQAIEGGEVRFDRAVFARCLDELATVECSVMEPSACLDIFVGAHPVGEPCLLDQECTSGAYCEYELGTCGVCRRALSAG